MTPPPHYMLHHISLGVADLQRAARFYDAALAPLGYARVRTDDTAVGYGSHGGDDKLAIKLREPALPPVPDRRAADPRAHAVDTPLKEHDRQDWNCVGHRHERWTGRCRGRHAP